MLDNHARSLKDNAMPDNPAATRSSISAQSVGGTGMTVGCPTRVRRTRLSAAFWSVVSCLPALQGVTQVISVTQCLLSL